MQLAKRKADDLEDFTENRSSLSPFTSQSNASLTLSNCPTATEINLSTTITPELTTAGTQLTEKILVEWSSASADDDAMDTSEGVDAEVEKELEALKACVGAFETELAGNEWAQVVLAQTY